MASAEKSRRSKSVVGYGFHPTDQELIGHFLNLKLTNVNLDMPIAEVKVCDFEPWELRDQSKIKSDDRLWFFFCPRDFKYAKSRRSKRTTKAGYWKPTGKIRELKKKKKVIGTKRSLVFHHNKKPTKWIMHEYDLPNNEGGFVVCKLKDKRIGEIDTGEPKMATAAVSPCESEITVNSNCVEGESSDHAGSHVKDHNLNDISAASTSDRGEQICSDFDPKRNEGIPDSACNEHDADEMIMASIDEGESELGFDLPPQAPDETTAYVMSSYKTDEPSVTVTSGIIIRNSDWNSYVSVSKEGEWSSLAETSDHGASAYDIAEMLTPEFQGIPTFFDEMKLLETESGPFDPSQLVYCLLGQRNAFPTLA